MKEDNKVEPQKLYKEVTFGDEFDIISYGENPIYLKRVAVPIEIKDCELRINGKNMRETLSAVPIVEDKRETEKYATDLLDSMQIDFMFPNSKHDIPSIRRLAIKMFEVGVAHKSQSLPVDDKKQGFLNKIKRGVDEFKKWEKENWNQFYISIDDLWGVLEEIQDKGFTTTPHTRSWVNKYRKEIEEIIKSKPTESQSLPVDDKPYGWVFKGKFFKEENDMRGMTMSEGNVPVPVYDSPVDKEDKISKALLEWLAKNQYQVVKGHDGIIRLFFAAGDGSFTLELDEAIKRFNQSLK